MGDSLRLYRGSLDDTNLRIDFIAPFRKPLGGQRIPCGGDQIHRAMKNFAPITHRVTVKLDDVFIRISHINTMCNLVIHCHINGYVVGLQRLVGTNQRGLVLKLPSQVIQSGRKADSRRQLQQPVTPVAGFAIGFFNHPQIMRRVARAQERRHQAGLGELYR